MHIENVRLPLTDRFCRKVSTLHSHQLLQHRRTWHLPGAKPLGESSQSTIQTVAFSWPSLHAGHENLQVIGLPLFFHDQEQAVRPPASEKESYFAGWALPILTACIWKEEEVKGGVLSAQHFKNLDLPHVNHIWALLQTVLLKTLHTFSSQEESMVSIKILGIMPLISWMILIVQEIVAINCLLALFK